MLVKPFKWPGGKHYLAKRINDMMPSHIHYVEPYAGGLSVLLAHEGDRSEVVNDLDGAVANFWRVLANPEQFARLHRLAQNTPVSRDAFDYATGYLSGWDGYIPNVGVAWAFFVQCRQSFAGTRKSFTPLVRTRLRRGMSDNASAWLSAVDGLPEVHARLRRVVVEHMEAVPLIEREDTPDTLFYLDPPYLHETRASKALYANEMSDHQHEELLKTLSRVEGKFLLSGYANGLYDAYAQEFGWRRVDFDLPNNQAGGEEKRRMVESVWCNYAC